MSLDAALALASQNGRICPRPQHWAALPRVHAFLAALPEAAWHHAGES